MNARRQTVGGWLRLFVTLLAVTSMLTHAVLPASAAPARGGEKNQVTAELKVLGASLCHDEDDGGGDGPVQPVPSCDHCPWCASSHHVTPALTLIDGAIPPAILVDSAPPSGVNIAAPPRAPPARANTPRAPPAI
jgi:Protein of unknown function (DUF2946)